jgi:hypothetical protein
MPAARQADGHHPVPGADDAHRKGASEVPTPDVPGRVVSLLIVAISIPTLSIVRA